VTLDVGLSPAAVPGPKLAHRPKWQPDGFRPPLPLERDEPQRHIPNDNAAVSIELRPALWRACSTREEEAVRSILRVLKKEGGFEMVKRLFLVVIFVLAVLTGYAIGQSDVKPPGGPVFSGGDLGFQADEPVADIILKNGRSSITGKFVVNVNGRWVEARLRSGIVPVK
jgi:hypothetical protein